MKARDWIALSTFGLFVVPGALVVYAAWFGGSGVKDGIYSFVQALRGAGGTATDDFLVGAGRFLTAWWWFIAMASVAFSTLAATCLAATEPETTVAAKALWVLSFFLLGVTVPIYCIWQMGGRPNHSFKPTPSARLN
jgi:hypothetical protein